MGSSSHARKKIVRKTNHAASQITASTVRPSQRRSLTPAMVAARTLEPKGPGRVACGRAPASRWTAAGRHHHPLVLGVDVARRPLLDDARVVDGRVGSRQRLARRRLLGVQVADGGAGPADDDHHPGLHRQYDHEGHHVPDGPVHLPDDVVDQVEARTAEDDGGDGGLGGEGLGAHSGSPMDLRPGAFPLVDAQFSRVRARRASRRGPGRRVSPGACISPSPSAAGPCISAGRY